MISPDAPLPASVWAAFGAMCLGMFMAILDIQIVATSLPAIQVALGVRPDQMSSIQTAYLIAEVVAIPLTGLLTRALTLRILFSVAVGVFTLASLGCAASERLETLLAWRVVQGFAGGILIPVAFSAVFTLFPPRAQPVATTIVGTVAVLAPTLGPVAGGWITQSFSWHWLFLVNLLPGIAALAAGLGLLPRGTIDTGILRRLDVVALGLLAAGLATLEIGLKRAPETGWGDGIVVALLLAAACLLPLCLRRIATSPSPLVDLGLYRDRGFALGSLQSFLFGTVLFGTIYLLPVFLGFVRGQGPLAIGETMLATGIAQLLSAPVAVWLAMRCPARPLLVFGFTLLAVGCGLSAFESAGTTPIETVPAQLARGFAIMFCIVPSTGIALGGLRPEAVPDASALFNLMRNLGGAIGLALIDTILFGRTAGHANEIARRLGARDLGVLDVLDLPGDLLSRLAAGPDADALAALKPFLDRAALAQSIGEAWWLLVFLLGLALLTVPFAREPVRS